MSDNMTQQIVQLDGKSAGKQFEGIGVVSGAGATAVLLKDYPEPQRSQILDMVFKPKFGASVSALLVEVPGDGNSTQGTMLSHQHTRDDLSYSRGYIWWILREANKRNPHMTTDAVAWSAPGWIGGGEFWSQDAADYYLMWLRGLLDVYQLELDAIGCRNERGVSIEFVKILRKTLDAGGFGRLKIHAFDNWGARKFNFVEEILNDEEALTAIDIFSAHTINSKNPKGHAVSPKVQAIAEKLGKPIWNTEDHIYKKGFDCAISIVQSFNDNYITSRVTRVVNWYDIAALYRVQIFAEDPPMLRAHWPWSGHYEIREALWGYAHYGQFCEVGWQYLDSGCGALEGGGSFVTLATPRGDYSVIIETKEATAIQEVRFETKDLAPDALCLWESNEREQFVRLGDVRPYNGAFTLALEPNTIYSLSTTRGQQKGAFADVPAAEPFPFPYYENFESYDAPEKYGYLPRYTADIGGAFELVKRPDGKGQCLRQVAPIPTISWVPDWLPLTILGDENWTDYEVNVDVYLHQGEAAGVMGRVGNFGYGGFTPKCYMAHLSASGVCKLSVIRGKINKKELVGDDEQQAIIKAQNDASEGGEKVLASVQLAHVGAHQWHNLKLRFEGSKISAFVDGKELLSVENTLYPRGLVALMADGDKDKLSTPYYDNLRINGLDNPVTEVSSASPRQTAIYG